MKPGTQQRPVCGSEIPAPPALAICGYSGAGKTTLIEALLPLLKARGLRVAVLKHDVHGLTLDRPGKDSDRLFRAGGDVLMQGPGEGFLRFHPASEADPVETVQRLIPFYDLILMEGHKDTPLPNKIWLRRRSADRRPEGVSGVRMDLGRQDDRVAAALKFVDSWLPRTWLRTPVYVGILIGGKSERMGTPKHLIRAGGRTWLERIVAVVRPLVEDVVLLGDAKVPEKLNALTILPDVRGAGGPVAGMLAAMRWAPLASWLFLACDLPLVSRAAIQWLLATRAPGVWATLPRSGNQGDLEPLLAHYDFRSRPLLEMCGRPSAIGASVKVITPALPATLAPAWTNMNTPADLVLCRNDVRTRGSLR